MTPGQTHKDGGRAGTAALSEIILQDEIMGRIEPVRTKLMPPRDHGGLFLIFPTKSMNALIDGRALFKGF